MTENESWTTGWDDASSDGELAPVSLPEMSTDSVDAAQLTDVQAATVDDPNLDDPDYGDETYLDPTYPAPDEVDDSGWTVAPEVAEITEDSQFWFQQGTGFTCGPAAVTQILEDFTGRPFDDEFAVANDAASMGWLSEDGMELEAVDDLLTRWGVPSHVEQGGTDPMTAFQTVDQYIAEGRSVVLFVDASEYWEGDTDRDAYHFVRVLDVDFDRGVAVLSDSGTPDGQGLEVPLSTLDDAWTDGLENQNAPTYGMVVSDVTDPDGVGAVPGSGESVIGQGQPFALLPITMSGQGYQEVLTGTLPGPWPVPPVSGGTDLIIQPENPLAPVATDPFAPVVTIESENPLAPVATDPILVDVTIQPYNPLAPADPQAPGLTIIPPAIDVLPPTDADTSTGPYLDDVDQWLADRQRLIEEGRWQQGTDIPLDPSLSPVEGEQGVDNAVMTTSGLTPEGTTRITDPMTGDTAYVPTGDTTPSLPYTQTSDRPADSTPPLSPDS